MKNVLIMTLALAFSSKSFADGAYFPIPGKNTIEREIHWAWKVLPHFLLACSNSPECNMSPEQQELARRISKINYGPESLKFVSGKTYPAIFKTTTKEAHRLVVTGNDPKSPIYINTDLYGGSGRSYGIPFWMGLLTHEMVHHQGFLDDAQRVPDQIGGFVTQAAQSLLSSIALPEEKNEVTVYILNAPTPQNSRTAEDFPNGGSTFRVLKIDPDLAVEDYAVATRNNLSLACEGKQVMYTRVAAETAVINPLPGSDTKKTATLTLSGDLICFDKPGWSAFKEVKYYTNVFDLKLVNGQLRTELYGTSGWGVTLLDNIKLAFATGEILEMKIPQDVAAGTELVVEAVIRHKLETKPSGCTYYMTSAEWVLPNRSSTSVFSPDTCEFTEIAKDTYRLRARRKILPTAKPVQLELTSLCLIVPEKYGQNCRATLPLKKTFVQVTNDRPTKELTIENIVLRGKRLSFLVRNGVQGESFHLNVEAQTADGSGYSLGIPLISEGHENVKNMRMSQVGDDIQFEVDIVVAQLNDVKFTLLKFESLIVVTRDFKYKFLDIIPLNLTLKP